MLYCYFFKQLIVLYFLSFQIFEIFYKSALCRFGLYGLKDVNIFVVWQVSTEVNIYGYWRLCHRLLEIYRHKSEIHVRYIDIGLRANFHEILHNINISKNDDI